MRNYECRVCGDLCDPGELTGGICIECREKEELETAMHGRAGMLESTDRGRKPAGFFRI